MSTQADSNGVASGKSIAMLCLFVAVAVVVASFGAIFAPGEWYASLEKPSWNPPSWLFGPVWTVLYAMIAIAAWRVWRTGNATVPVVVWFLHLIPNALWSYFFFGAQRMDWALIDILVLVTGILSTTALFAQRDRIAALMMIPYLLWVSFASVLNWTLLSMNLTR